MFNMVDIKGVLMHMDFNIIKIISINMDMTITTIISISMVIIAAMAMGMMINLKSLRL